MAAVWKAPVVFIITNNLYGEYSPVSATTAGDGDLARRADPYGMPGLVVDGQDVDVVHDDGRPKRSSGPARARARPSSR